MCFGGITPPRGLDPRLCSMQRMKPFLPKMVMRLLRLDLNVSCIPLAVRRCRCTTHRARRAAPRCRCSVAGRPSTRIRSWPSKCMHGAACKYRPPWGFSCGPATPPLAYVACAMRKRPGLLDLFFAMPMWWRGGSQGGNPGSSRRVLASWLGRRHSC